MSRRINTGEPLTDQFGLSKQGKMQPKLQGQQTQEDYLGRLVKYIPAELVVLYLTVRGVISAAEQPSDRGIVLWGVTLAVWILVPVYFWMVTARDEKKPLRIQMLLATIAFPVWVIAISGPPVSSLPWYSTHQYFGSVVLAFITVIFGWIKPPQGA